MDELSYLITKDGSITLAEKSTGEWYHNSAGAYEESLVNYCEPALALLKREGKEFNSLRLLDVCFGMGYNSFTLIEELLRAQIPVSVLEVVAVELDENLLPAMARVLNQDFYVEIEKFGLKEAAQLFDGTKVRDGLLSFSLAPEKKSGSTSSIERIDFKLYLSDLRKYLPRCAKEEAGFDLVFHDPFSPNRVPQFWTKEIFDIYYRLLKPKAGTLFTYSVATAVRAGLIESGFSIFRTRAVGAKSGGTVALSASGEAPENLTVSGQPLFFSLDEEELERLKLRAGVPYRDPELNRARNDILKVRQLEQDELSAL